MLLAHIIIALLQTTAAAAAASGSRYNGTPRYSIQHTWHNPRTEDGNPFSAQSLLFLIYLYFEVHASIILRVRMRAPDLVLIVGFRYNIICRVFMCYVTTRGTDVSITRTYVGIANHTAQQTGT